MKKVIYLLLMIVLVSCFDKEPKPKFILKNKSNQLLDSIIIGVFKYDSTKLTDVKKNETRWGKIIFNEKIISDGDYFVEVYAGDKLLNLKRFGYYTNGAPLNKKFNIIIYKDSIKVSY